MVKPKPLVTDVGEYKPFVLPPKIEWPEGIGQRHKKRSLLLVEITVRSTHVGNFPIRVYFLR